MLRRRAESDAPAMEQLEVTSGDDIQLEKSAPATEFVRETLSESQLMARASAVSRRYEKKLLPPRVQLMAEQVAQCFLVR